MNDIIPTSTPSVLQPSNVPTTITLPGDNNTIVAQANNVNTINVFVPTTQPNGVMLPTKHTLNTDCYNLFVIGGETFNLGHFVVPKDRALTESISPELKKRYAGLDEEAIAQIKTYPALFACENYQYGHTSEDQTAYFGLIVDIKVQENGANVYYQLLSPIQQQRLNEIAYNLAIKGTSSFNELNRTHWTIKQINLIEALRDAGISVLAPT